jgi:hypothetical protein
MELTCLSGVTQVLTAPIFLFSITAQHVYINNTELRQQQCTVRFVQMLGLYTLAKFYQEICAMIGMRPGRTPGRPHASTNMRAVCLHALFFGGIAGRNATTL